MELCQGIPVTLICELCIDNSTIPHQHDATGKPIRFCQFCYGHDDYSKVKSAQSICLELCDKCDKKYPFLSEQFHIIWKSHFNCTSCHMIYPKPDFSNHHRFTLKFAHIYPLGTCVNGVYLQFCKKCYNAGMSHYVDSVRHGRYNITDFVQIIQDLQEIPILQKKAIEAVITFKCEVSDIASLIGSFL
jgi:hypothetical protein